MSIKIALAGNPNCGKTTLFNELTGSSQYVGNWPGVTVEKKEGNLKGHKDVIITDLPGIYSLSPYTPEEVVTRKYLIEENPDVIINLVDASNIERNLYLTTQLIEIGIPVMIALNMIDIVRKNGDKIDTQKLGEQLGCEVIEASTLKGIGIKEMTDRSIALAENHIKSAVPHTFSPKVEAVLDQICSAVPSVQENAHSRWLTIKLFERDKKVLNQFQLSDNIKTQLETITSACETELDDDAESIITNERYEYITDVTKVCVQKNKSGLSSSDKIDRILTNRWLALPIFAAIMWLVYYVSISTVGTMATDWVNDVLFGKIIPPAIEDFLVSVSAADWLQSLILNGILGGVGAVLGFLPQIIVLFFFLAILEDCGYMSRIAFIMDRIFCKFGLSGKSFIPILIGTGCGVPGIMASRTIENEKERKMTIIVTTFIPCSAKLPIIALIAGTFFPDSSWVGPSAYFVGIAAIILSGIILKKTKLFAGDPSPFVMELPPYHIPGIKSVLIHVWDRGKSFVKKAGTVIFVSCGIIWFLQSFNWSLQMVDERESMLAAIGSFIAPVFAPLGWGDWTAAVAAITGLVAKENIVGTFGVLFGTADVSKDATQTLGSMSTIFNPVSAYSFLVFNLLCAPCLAAIGAIKHEMASWKWTGIAVGYQTLLAFVVAFILNQLGSIIFLGTGFGIGQIIALIFIAVFLWLLFRSYKPEDKTSLSAVSARG